MIAATDKLIGWVLTLGRVDYSQALLWQRGLVKMRREGMARDTIIFVEHPPVVTVGKDGHAENYEGLEVEPHFIERGGDVTYHGPGQLVVYFVFNLTRRGRDLHRFLKQIQQGIMAALKEIGLKSRMDDEHTGVWVGKEKIASVGVAVKQWISYHGAAINLNTELNDFKRISPCGLESGMMTSASKLLNRKIDMDEFARILGDKYSRVFDTEFYPVKLEELAEDIESQAGGYTI